MSHDVKSPISQLPIVCTLSEPEQSKRRQEILEEIFAATQSVQELPDGYGFQFPGDRAWTTRLMEFVLFERRCCAFLTFELLFEPDQGPIWLRLRGAEGVKAFIKAELEKLNTNVR